MFIYIDITNENLAMPFLTLFGIEHANKTVVSFLYLFCVIDTLLSTDKKATSHCGINLLFS